jgi:hypothetical protein
MIEETASLQRRRLRSSTPAYVKYTGGNAMWEDAIVPFKFDASCGRFCVDQFLPIFRKYREETCVDWDSEEVWDPYVLIQAHDGGTSFTSSSEEGTAISMELSQLDLSTASHESMHALGFWHTHQRSG